MEFIDVARRCANQGRTKGKKDSKNTTKLIYK